MLGLFSPNKVTRIMRVVVFHDCVFSTQEHSLLPSVLLAAGATA